MGVQGASDGTRGHRVYIETYGCQMNVNDSEVVASVLGSHGYRVTEWEEEADVVLINTCAIRDNAEVRIRGRLAYFKALREERSPHLLIAVLGCMAERLKKALLVSETGVNVVVGPDAYRDLPRLLAEARTVGQSINTRLSKTETYADIAPLRYGTNGISAFTSIMRGCDNMCTYCVVPFTRGRERSRGPKSIVREVLDLRAHGYREVTLLGQNVDSYRFDDGKGHITTFPDLLEEVAVAVPSMRIRFATSHPKDITDDVLYTMAMYENICHHIHLPVQSGSTAMLERMRRTYSRELYLRRVEQIRRILPGCSITADIIAGFCGETEEEHRETLSLMREVMFDSAFMFAYSERPGTYAARHMEDDVPAEEKNRRLQEIIALQNEHSKLRNSQEVGREFEVLVEGPSRKNPEEYCGRTEQNKMVVFPRGALRPGDYAVVQVRDSTSSTLLANLVEPVLA